MKKNLEGKNIVLGISGGIAAYKSAELLRLFIKNGAAVRVMMTASACQFVGPTTFEALSGKPVCTDLFDPAKADASIQHIEWAREAQAVVIAPATANIIGKYAGGIADDALSTFLLAVTCPVIICPAMNTNMYLSPPVQRNLETLQRDGQWILTPDSGEMACGTEGPGRLPEPPFILDRLMACLTPKDLAGKRVLVTAGPTREFIDPVRFISNPSTGKMGYAVARAAEHRGAEVTLISGPTHLPAPNRVQVVDVVTAAQMAEAVFERIETSDIIIKSAAVSDYRPKNTADQKIKKGEAEEVMILEQTQDILKAVGKEKTRQFLVGFAAETQSLRDNATAKLTKKNLDMIAANNVTKPGSGFGTDTNQVTFFFRDGTQETLEQMDKEAVAHVLLDRVAERLS